MFFWMISLLLTLHPISGKYLRSDESFWKNIQNSLQKKEGKSPSSIRSFPDRKPGEFNDDFRKEIENLKKFPSDNKDEDEANSNIANFQQSKSRNTVKKSSNYGVGQVMRGESAKEIYKAQIKYDTVDGFHQKLNQQNSTKPKNRDIVILKSRPKSLIHDLLPSFLPSLIKSSPFVRKQSDFITIDSAVEYLPQICFQGRKKSKIRRKKRSRRWKRAVLEYRWR
jgi:hypothetical protein